MAAHLHLACENGLDHSWPPEQGQMLMQKIVMTGQLYTLASEHGHTEIVVALLIERDTSDARKLMAGTALHLACRWVTLRSPWP
jgi:hypothetical protein